jgi:hypothetical protein
MSNYYLSKTREPSLTTSPTEVLSNLVIGLTTPRLPTEREGGIGCKRADKESIEAGLTPKRGVAEGREENALNECLGVER